MSLIVCQTHFLFVNLQYINMTKEELQCLKKCFLEIGYLIFVTTRIESDTYTRFINDIHKNFKDLNNNSQIQNEGT